VYSKVLSEIGCWTACRTRASVGSTSAAKWPTKSSSGSQAKLCSSVRGWRAPRRRSGAEQDAEALAPVDPEGGDVDERDDVRRVLAQRGDDLAAVGVAGDDGRPSWRASTWRRRATSASVEVSGNCGAVTL
jgi:hypothetical protein